MTDISIPYRHQQSAHCETGVTSGLLTHHGIPVSEAMVFGIGSGLFFGYFPFIKLNDLPLTAFRITTGGIMKRVAKRLGVGIRWETFRKPEAGMGALDRYLEQGVPVGCRAGAYWLPYFPRRYRFHFNMHHLVVVGRSGDDYLVSDPVFPELVVCPRKDLMKARFARGPMPPKGRLFFMEPKKQAVDIPAAARKGIRETCNSMLKAPFPLIGVRGIGYLSRKVPLWPRKLGEEKAAAYLAQLVRMQEEIGTGGAGFRFMYAAFLQEVAMLNGNTGKNGKNSNNGLLGISERMTAVGDQWRRFALTASRILKRRSDPEETYEAMGRILDECAAGEKAVFDDLAQTITKAS